ncbi:MAG: hypothetical protein CK532_04325 [Flavobacteriales bacterium]|nr:MAG: hypothetical protein CK532_04325 [Flavobacteriales bacterium]
MKNPRTRATQLVNVLMPSVPSEMYPLLRQFPFLVFPFGMPNFESELKGKMPPIPNGSITDFTCTLKKAIQIS